LILGLNPNADTAQAAWFKSGHVRLDIMWLMSKMEMSVINKMANVFVVNFITEEPWYLAK